MRRHHILIPIAALLATLPLILHGCSCGHDLDFHLQSWLDAAHQLRHGTLYPRWTFSAAYNAGEPRFLFYPPLSWLLGAILTMLFPIAATPAIFTFLAFTAAGFAMHRLARPFTSANAALLASTLYLANPYMLFNAFERTAYAELLAAAWIPLLLLGVLRKRPTIHGIAIPLALLWLTNAPAAVMGCYTFAILAAIRLLHTLKDSEKAGAPDLSHLEIGVSATPRPSMESAGSPARLALTYLAGTSLGLTLPAFYLLPAAYERRYVQIAMAIIPNMRIQDNFLFGHTADAAHNAVLHTASLLAVTLLALAFAATLALLLQRKPPAGIPKPEANPLPFIPTALFLATILIAFLLIPASTPVWLHLPNLAFLQFPWRLLTILSAVLAFALALLFHRNKAATNQVPRAFRLRSHGPHREGASAPGVSSSRTTNLAVLLGPLALSLLCIPLYRQPCEATDLPTSVAQLFATHHGVAPTDEYTPTDADNDILRPNDPAWWLSPNPAAFAPHTVPNPAATDPSFDGDIPPEDTLSIPAPQHLTFNLPQPETLILNLRDYPGWDLTRNTTQQPPHLQRDDGLLAIALPAGPSTIDIHWRRTLDQQLGLALTACALLLLALTFHRSRKIV